MCVCGRGGIHRHPVNYHPCNWQDTMHLCSSISAIRTTCHHRVSYLHNLITPTSSKLILNLAVHFCFPLLVAIDLFILGSMECRSLLEYILYMYHSYFPYISIEIMLYFDLRALCCGAGYTDTMNIS